MEQKNTKFGEKTQAKPKGSFLSVFIISLMFFILGWSLGSNKFNISFLNNNRIQTENTSLSNSPDYKSVNDVYDILRNN